MKPEQQATYEAICRSPKMRVACPEPYPAPNKNHVEWIDGNPATLCDTCNGEGTVPLLLESCRGVGRIQEPTGIVVDYRHTPVCCGGSGWNPVPYTMSALLVALGKAGFIPTSDFYFNAPHWVWEVRHDSPGSAKNESRADDPDEALLEATVRALGVEVEDAVHKG